MYVCDNCGKQIGPKEKQYTIQVIRAKEYTEVRYEFDEKIKKKKKIYYTTTGHEAIGELHYCKDCDSKCEDKIIYGNEKRLRSREQRIESRDTKIKKRSEVYGSRNQHVG